MNDFVGPEYDCRRIAPFRVCDQAHNIILRMLRRQAEMIFVQRDLAMSKPEQLAARDVKLDKLRKELDSTKQ